MSEPQWVRVVPGVPLYAREGWRIQKQSKGWRWWYVIQEPLVARSPHGVARTLRDAKNAVEVEIRGATPTKETGER